MKTTEIFVEQVLIGLLVLATGFLPYIDHNEITNFYKENSYAEGALLIAIAYLLGIGLDRFADTLFSRLDQYHRLTFALKLIKEGKQYPGSDPYPEDYLQIKILQDSKNTTDKMNYFRSRMRLSRALAIFTPALTISALLSLVRDSGQDKDIILVFLGVTALIYVLCFFCVLLLPKLLKIFKQPRTCEIVSGSAFYFGEFVSLDNIKNLCSAIRNDIKDNYKSPEFEDPHTIKEWMALIKWLDKLLEYPQFYDILHKKEPNISFSEENITELVDATKNYRNKNFSDLGNDEQNKIKRLNRLVVENTYPKKIPKCYFWCSWRSWWWREPTTWAAVLLFFMMISIAVCHEVRALLVLLTGLGICFFSAWSWWRISETFMKFLMDCDKFDKK